MHLNGHTFAKLCLRYDAAINGLKILQGELETIDWLDQCGDTHMTAEQREKFRDLNRQLNEQMENFRCDL